MKVQRKTITEYNITLSEEDYNLITEIVGGITPAMMVEIMGGCSSQGSLLRIYNELSENQYS